jgi:hypothetical protein
LAKTNVPTKKNPLPKRPSRTILHNSSQICTILHNLHKFRTISAQPPNGSFS